MVEYYSGIKRSESTCRIPVVGDFAHRKMTKNGHAYRRVSRKEVVTFGSVGDVGSENGHIFCWRSVGIGVQKVTQNDLR